MAIDSNHFNAKSEIEKYKLNESTFDIIDVDSFHNIRFGTVLGYLFAWFLMLLSCALLGTDIYTCLSILVFHHWSNGDYQVYEYSVAKWIFTGCIIFQFCLLLYHWVWAIHTYRTKNIALTYINTIARNLYTIRSYNYYCLFASIEMKDFFDWSCFYCYEQLGQALQILIADAPRQVINFMTIRFYATGGELNNDIISNIKHIANTNITLSVILSLMCASVVIFAFFFFKFLFGILMYIPIKVKLNKRDYSSIKKYCCDVVNDTIRLVVLKHHKSKRELLDKGILDKHDIKMNPLLNSSTTSFASYKNTSQVFNEDDDSTFGSISTFPHNLKKPVASHGHNDNKKLYNIVGREETYESLPMSNLGQNPSNPFSDKYGVRSESLASLIPASAPSAPRKVRKAPTHFNDSFTQKNQSQTMDQSTLVNPFESTDSLSKIPFDSQHNLQRSDSISSLTYTSAPVGTRRFPTYQPPQSSSLAHETSTSLNSSVSQGPFAESSHTDLTHSSPFAQPHNYSQESLHSSHTQNGSDGSDSFNPQTSSSRLLMDEYEPPDLSQRTTPYPINYDDVLSESSDTAPYPVRGISTYAPDYKYDRPSR